MLNKRDTLESILTPPSIQYLPRLPVIQRKGEYTLDKSSVHYQADIERQRLLYFEFFQFSTTLYSIMLLDKWMELHLNNFGASLTPQVSHHPFTLTFILPAEVPPVHQLQPFTHMHSHWEHLGAGGGGGGCLRIEPLAFWSLDNGSIQRHLQY